MVFLLIAGLSLKFCALSFAQNVTVINHFAGDTTGRGLEGFELTRSGEHKIIVNYYEPVSEKQLSRLEAVVGASLDFYLDENIRLSGSKITLERPVSQMIKEMNELVRSAVKFYEYRDISKFSGFSEKIESQLKDLDNKKVEILGQNSKGIDPEKQALFHAIAGLKKEVNDEVGNYSTNNLVVYSGSEETYIDPQTRERLLAELNSPFDPNATLSSMLSSDPVGAISLIDESFLPLRNDDNTNPANKTSDDSFEARVLEMLEKNNSKLDNMQVEINDLRAEQVRMWKEKQDLTNDQLQSQISELRGMVVDLVRLSHPETLADINGGILISPSPTPADLSNLPPNVTIYFPNGSTMLDAVARMTLNEMVDILARNPQLKVLITGFADRSGTEWKNLLLSQSRAAEVKKFFAASGLPEDRFVMQYYGARDSQSSNPSDRKVVLEFIR